MKDTEYIKEVAVYHRRMLLDRTKEVNDGAFSSGASWAVYALDRVISACEGERDLEALGLIPRVKPAERAVQGELFGVGDV